MDEPLLDFAQAAGQLRHDGYAEAQIARAAGFPDLAGTASGTRAAPCIDHIIEIVLREPIGSLHPDDLERHRDYIRKVLSVVNPRTAVSGPRHT